MSTVRAANLPVTYQYTPVRIPARQEEPDTPDSIHRSTEQRALRQIAQCIRYRQQAGGRDKLTGIHLELLKLERGALQYLPQLTHDERLEFILSSAHLRGVSHRQVESILDQASDIIMWRELQGMSTEIFDIDESQVKRLYRSASIGQSRRFQTVGRRSRHADRVAVA